jgi:ABC-type uncharacterized transport system fused permease/ATPase subunit
MLLVPADGSQQEKCRPLLMLLLLSSEEASLWYMTAWVQVMFLPQQALIAPGATLWEQLSYGRSQPASPQQAADVLLQVRLQHLLVRAGGDLHQPADWSGTG